MEDYVYDVFNQEKWWWTLGRRALVTSLWGQYGKNKASAAILDIGCGPGTTLQELAGCGAVYGIDVSKAAVDYCYERGLDSVTLGDASALPYRDERFDLVISIDVLEHVDDDMGALAETYRVCRRGGTLIATVPAFNFLWSRRDEQCHHRRRYSLDEFRSKVSRAGFKIIRATYINMPLFVPLFLMVKMGQLSSKKAPSLKMDYALVPPPLNRLLARVVQYEARLLSHTNLPIGTSIACVSVKPER
jgi:SAM-dependent methyltransferase